VAVYRDGSKRTQPLSTARPGAEAKPARRRLPDEREAITHKFSIAGHEGYLTVGKYEDGSPGELFVVMSKEGSVVSGLLDGFATAVSLALQYGVPLKVLIDKFSHSRYEPSGFTTNPRIRIAKSITDYIFRWLALKFLPADEVQAAIGEGEDLMLAAGDKPSLTHSPEAPAVGRGSAPGAAIDAADASFAAAIAPVGAADVPAATWPGAQAIGTAATDMDAPPCPDCGSLMIRAGSCHRCGNCGATSGCS
jgi:ribonucleoside-diphosphate reductase alpha chain